MALGVWGRHAHTAVSTGQVGAGVEEGERTQYLIESGETLQ